MSIEIICPCGQTLIAQDKHIGRKTKCPKCSEAIIVPDPAQDIENVADTIESDFFDVIDAEDSRDEIIEDRSSPLSVLCTTSSATRNGTTQTSGRIENKGEPQASTREPLWMPARPEHINPLLEILRRDFNAALEVEDGIIPMLLAKERIGEATERHREVLDTIIRVHSVLKQHYESISDAQLHGMSSSVLDEAP